MYCFRASVDGIGLGGDRVNSYWWRSWSDLVGVDRVGCDPSLKGESGDGVGEVC